jgi:hypothetical protein
MPAAAATEGGAGAATKPSKDRTGDAPRVKAEEEPEDVYAGERGTPAGRYYSAPHFGECAPPLMIDGQQCWAGPPTTPAGFAQPRWLASHPHGSRRPAGVRRALPGLRGAAPALALARLRGPAGARRAPPPPPPPRRHGCLVYNHVDK